MSREDLTNFVNAVEHRFHIRKEISETTNLEEIILIAQKYGFKINKQDFQDDAVLEVTENWFRKSKIYPVKKFS
tara:strand:- start:319 stop:540 length:222 start_codon:yes stop_codon:yes gene_type:complete